METTVMEEKVHTNRSLGAEDTGAQEKAPESCRRQTEGGKCGQETLLWFLAEGTANQHRQS